MLCFLCIFSYDYLSLTNYQILDTLSLHTRHLFHVISHQCHSIFYKKKIKQPPPHVFSVSGREVNIADKSK